MRRENSEFKTAFLSEAGSSIQNKDYFAFTELEDMACYVIADGLDADEEVESAELAVKSILGQFIDKPTMSKRKLKKYMHNAHKLLKAESTRFRLKASVTIVVTNYTKFVWAVAGHSRLYMFRNGVLHLKSKDQSLAQSFANEGKIPLDWVNHHEERHNLLNYMGIPNEFTPFVSKKTRLNDGDTLILCTPGVWEKVDSAEITDAVGEAKDGQKLVDTLEEILLSRQEAVVPNYTVAAIFANKIFQEDPKRKSRIVKRIALILIPLLLIGGGTAFYMVRSATQKAEWVADMFEYNKNGDTFVGDGDYLSASKEYSEAKNFAKRVKDPVHRELYAKKQRIAYLIAEGDTFLKEGEFEKAIENYEKAMKEAKTQNVFDQEELEGKIAQARSVSDVLALMKQGDLKLEAQDYKGALSIYQKARKAALEVSYTSGEKAIREKMDEAEEKITSIERELRQLAAEKLEKQGDHSSSMEKFEEAMTAYAGAQEIYQEIEMLEKVLNMERKITKAQEDMQAKLSEQEQETKQGEGGRLEQKGDDFFASENYGQAIASFTMARQLYQDAGLLDKAMQVGEKLAKAEQEQQFRLIEKQAANSEVGNKE